jgi:hypothetical protein
MINRRFFLHFLKCNAGWWGGWYELLIQALTNTCPSQLDTTPENLIVMRY